MTSGDQVPRPIMTVADPRTGIEPPPAGAPRGDRAPALRLWDAPLVAHGAALFALMVSVAAFIGTGSTFTDDEGAGILQAQAIEHGHWTLANPLPSVDPTAANYPVHQAVRGKKGIAPLGKNLAYFAVLAILGLGLGTAGMVGLSIAGTVAAALLAARLARELGTSERVTFWIVGLGSPLFFDGFLVVAHTLAAALAAGSVVLGLRFLRGGRLPLAAGASACICAATLVRTEAALWALALAVGALAAGVRSGTNGVGRRGLILAIGVAAAMLAGREIDAILTHWAIGSAVSDPAGTIAGTGSRGTVHDQVLGLLRSWLQLSGAPRVVFTTIVVVLALTAIWARATRRGRSGSRSALALAAAVASFSVYLAVARPHQYVAGIAIVFPLLWAGLWLLGRPVLRNPSSRLLVVSSGVYGLLVAATEYSDAGAWQPGRYFFLALPVIVPVVVLALADLRSRLPAPARTTVMLCVVAAMLATSTAAVDALRFNHQRSGDLAATVRAVAAQANAGGGTAPVAVTTYPFLPRSAWATFPLVRWQLVPQQRLSAYGDALARAGIRRFVLVTPAPHLELIALAPWYAPVSDKKLPLSPQWHLIVVTLS